MHLNESLYRSIEIDIAEKSQLKHESSGSILENPKKTKQSVEVTCMVRGIPKILSKNEPSYDLDYFTIEELLEATIRSMKGAPHLV